MQSFKDAVTGSKVFGAIALIVGMLLGAYLFSSRGTPSVTAQPATNGKNMPPPQEFSDKGVIGPVVNPAESEVGKQFVMLAEKFAEAKAQKKLADAQLETANSEKAAAQVLVANTQKELTKLASKVQELAEQVAEAGTDEGKAKRTANLQREDNKLKAVIRQSPAFVAVAKETSFLGSTFDKGVVSAEFVRTLYSVLPPNQQKAYLRNMGKKMEEVILASPTDFATMVTTEKLKYAVVMNAFARLQFQQEQENEKWVATVIAR